MRHEEGLVVDRWGMVLEHAVCTSDRLRLSYAPDAVRAARDGGLLMHSHPIDPDMGGTSFGSVDLALLLKARAERGMVMVATTSHEWGGVERKVRYILDTRNRTEPLEPVSGPKIDERWWREFTLVSAQLWHEDTGELSEEEGMALLVHLTMERVVRRFRVAYRMEIVE